MCGRYTLTRPELIPDEFEISEVRIPPRFNIAPTQEAPVVRLDREGRREGALLRWGLVPHWSAEKAPSARTINARAESLLERPSFRDAFRFRRCLVPADGFFEWTPADQVESLERWLRDGASEPPVAGPKLAAGRRQPWYITLDPPRLFAFAGLWEWNRRGAELLETFTIITCDPNERLRPFHDRMPVILAREHYSVWLDPETPLEVCQALLVPCPAGAVNCVAVDPIVNKPDVDDPRCIRPLASVQPGLFGAGLP
ncbi:MAG: SOS response-associated peptidase [Acidobacteriota bacterium]